MCSVCTHINTTTAGPAAHSFSDRVNPVHRTSQQDVPKSDDYFTVQTQTPTISIDDDDGDDDVAIIGRMTLSRKSLSFSNIRLGSPNN